MNFIPEDDVYNLTISSRITSVKNKECFLSWFQSLGFLKNISFTSRKEIEFLDLLEQILAPMGIKGVRQFRCNNKMIDFYIPALKLAIEYDENNHLGYSEENQKGRQTMLEKELQCTFVRLSDENTNGYNIGLVIKSMFEIENSLEAHNSKHIA